MFIVIKKVMRLKKELVLRQIGNDFIIVEPEQDQVDLSKVYTLNETAAWLWQQLRDRDFTQEVMVDLLLSEYDVSVGRANEDAVQLIEIFKKQGLLASF